MQYGYFDNKNKEYVITRPDTPLPWINYLSNGKYCAMVSNTGGGYSFYIMYQEKFQTHLCLFYLIFYIA